MIKLAERWGLSGRGLAKLCERHAIPVPGRGHWALTRAGYVMERDPLPEKPAPDGKVEITSNSEHAREEDPVVVARIAYERDHPIVVPDKLARPHPLVVRAREDNASSLPISVSPKQLPRALRVMDALFRACVERGFAVSQTCEEREVRTLIKVHEEYMRVSLRETSRRTDHVLTAYEEKRKREGFDWHPRYDYGPSGQLELSIDNWAHGTRRRWRDRERRPLESCLNEVVVALVRISVTVLTPQRLEWERQRLIEHERERLRAIQRTKLDALNRALPEWRQAQELRAFIDAVEAEARATSGFSVEGGPLAEWLRWARDLAERSDPVRRFVTT
jgi:hypothetical protein